MSIKKRFKLSNKVITITTLCLVTFGTIMIGSAEMGNAVGDSQYLVNVLLKQIVYALIDICSYFFFMLFDIKKSVSMSMCFVVYVIILAALLLCRISGMVNGAYAWIFLPGGASIQPSEFAKAFTIFFGAKLLGEDDKEKNEEHFWTFVITSMIYVVIIIGLQNDLGSAVVLGFIFFCMAFIPHYKELKRWQRYMVYAILFGIGAVLFILSPISTKLIEMFFDGYKADRFLVAADPFKYRFDNGYHIVMSLVSFANGSLFGQGFGESVHKYMNFPNPSNDFILPIIVEEWGIIGFGFVFICYGFVLWPIMKRSIKTTKMTSKLVYIGTFVYFIVHFILNVGGVSGLIPLTGVPLLLISSGGSSLMASLIALGLVQNEIINNELEENESNSREI